MNVIVQFCSSVFILKLAHLYHPTSWKFIWFSTFDIGEVAPSLRRVQICQFGVSVLGGHYIIIKPYRARS